MLEDIKNKYLSANSLFKLIYINLIVFICLQILKTIGFLIDSKSFDIIEFISVPSSIENLLFKPWTLATYMFSHEALLHILFNMLWLYFAGQIFLQYFNSKKLVSLYVLGGLAGALSYLIAYNTFPVFQNIESGLMGASASVLALLFAVAYHVPNYKVNLIFIGQIPIKYIAAASIFIDIISIPQSNAGGHIAHLGGALFGLYFIHQWKKGKDVSLKMETFLNYLFDKFSKRNLKTVHKRPQTDQQYRDEKANRSQKVDQILDKIAKSGYDSLSEKEKEYLFKNSKKL